MTGRPPTPPSRLLLWAAFLAAPAVWLVHFVLASSASEMLCVSADGSGVGIVLLIATLFAWALAASATVLAWRVGRWARRSRPHFDEFLPEAGWLMGLLVTFVLAAELVPVLWLGCGGW